MSEPVTIPSEVSNRFKTVAGQPYDDIGTVFTKGNAVFNAASGAVVVANLTGEGAEHVFVAPHESDIVEHLRDAGFEQSKALAVPLIEQRKFAR